VKADDTSSDKLVNNDDSENVLITLESIAALREEFEEILLAN
jgi:hypothetical protein